MRRRIAQGLAVFLLVSLGAAQGPNSSVSVNSQSQKTKSGATAQAKTPRTKAYQVGTASWYGDYFEGKATASGEPFNMYDLTAAHPTLPLGSWVKVTNLRNRKVVVVRVNDRGPIVPGRIIDLSFGAAEALQFNGRGLQPVRLDVIRPQSVAVLEPIAYRP
jgi:rare lipoprotein A